MSMNTRSYGIKFPFTNNNQYGNFIDLNESLTDSVASDILHILLTPLRTRIRKPDFGTNLVKYIFEPNDEETWDDVKNEAKKAVSRYVSNAALTNIEVLRDDNNDGIYLYLKYSVKKGNTFENNELGVKLV